MRKTQRELVFEFVPRSYGKLTYHRFTIHEKINAKSHAYYSAFCRVFMIYMIEYFCSYAVDVKHIEKPHIRYIDYPYHPHGTKFNNHA